MILRVAAMIVAVAQCYYQTYSNFTSSYSAVFTVYDDAVYGPNSYMKVNLIYENPPQSLEDKGGMWLGVGLGKSSMLGSDLVICQWNDTSMTAWCQNYLANSKIYPYVVPAPATTQTVWTVSGYKADNTVVLTFKRFLTPSDSNGYTIRSGASVPVTWAYGFPDRLYHGTKNRGSQTVLFAQTVLSDSHRALLGSVTLVSSMIAFLIL